MAKKPTMRVKVTEYGEQQLEALGLPARMEFELNDGSAVTVLHPWLWDDETLATYDAAALADGDEARDIRLARAALGEKEHQRFIAGGGKSRQITLAIELMNRPQKIGDGNPKVRK